MSRRRHTSIPAFLKNVDAAAKWAVKYVDLDFEKDWRESLGFEYDADVRHRALTYSRFAHEAYRKGSIAIWRLVEVPRGTTPNLQCLGRAWSYQPEGVGSYGTIPYAKGTELERVVMEGRVHARDVDWEYGFASFMVYGEEQSEVSVHDHSPILVVKIGKESFSPPLRGMSGTTPYDVWQPGCETPLRKTRAAWRRANL